MSEFKDGEIVAAAQEERFTRFKNDPNFPENAIKYCLAEGKIQISEITAIVFYEKPFLISSGSSKLIWTGHRGGFLLFSRRPLCGLKKKYFYDGFFENISRKLFPENYNANFCLSNIMNPMRLQLFSITV